MRIATSRLRQISQSIGWAFVAALIVLFCSFIISLQANAATYKTFGGGNSVIGKLVKSDGTAVLANARINVNPDGPCSTGNCGGGADVQSDGSFTVTEGIGNGQYRVEVNIWGDELSNQAAPDPVKITLSGGQVDIGTIKLAAPNILGTVKDPAGGAISIDYGAQQNINVEIRSKDYTINKWINTSQDGSFKTYLGKGEYIAIAHTNGMSFTDGELAVTVTDPAASQNITVNLTNPAIVGQVKKPDGSALSLSNGQWINVNLYNQDRTIQKYSGTDSDGNFKLPAIPYGTYTIEVQPQGWNKYTSNKTTITYSGTQLLVPINLSSPQVKGKIYKTEADALASNNQALVGNAGINVHNQDWTQQSWTQSDSEGNYAVGGLPDGHYTMEVNVPWGTAGLISNSFEVDLTADAQTKNLYFSVATKKISGKVLKKDGTPVAGASVNANREGGAGYANAQTGSDGGFTLEVGGGAWNVNVWPNNAPGMPAADWIPEGFGQRAEFKNDASTETATINFSVVSATATVSGKILKADGTPITNANVDVRNDKGQGNNSQVKPTGEFVVKVAAGSYRVNVWSPDQGLTFPEMNITITDGETKDVGTLTAKTKEARITGRVVKKGTAEGVPGVRVNANLDRAPGWSNTTTDATGNFELAVTKGMWHINIDQGSNTSYVYSGPPIDVSVETETSRTALGKDIELIYADVVIKGKIVDVAGKVIPNFCSWAFARPVSTGNMGWGPEYGGPVNCQTSSFEIRVPSKVASAYVLGTHTPPNSDYSSAETVSIAVLADQTYERNIVLKKNDASISGKLVDQNGAALTSCNFRGDVFVNTENMWRNSPIQPDCSYKISVLGGTAYRIGYWVEESQGILQQPPTDDKIEVPLGGNITRNISVKKADATITGKVLDPNGNPTGNAFVFASNHPEFEKEGPPEKEDFEKMINSGAKVNPDGTFSISILSGHIYEVGVQLPPESTYLPADSQRVDLTKTKTASVTIKLNKALGKMTGKVTIGGAPVQFAFVHCWKEEGGFNGAPAEWGGSYSLNYSAGTWHCGADTFTGTEFFRSEEVTIKITNQTAITQNFELKKSGFTVPPAVSKTFDATTSQVITLDNGTIINIPGGTLASSGNVTLRATPTIDLIHTKLEKPFGVGYELEAQDENSNTISKFNSNVTITFAYTDEQLKELGLTEDSLVSKYYDEQTGTWKDPNGVTQNTENNTITISTNHFTKFAVVAAEGANASKAKTIVAVTAENGEPEVSIWGADGKKIKSFLAFDRRFRGQVNVRSGDLDGDSADEIVAVPGGGGGPHLRVFSKSGKLLAQKFVYDKNFNGGVLLELADTDGNGTKEIIVAAKDRGEPVIKIYRYSNKKLTLVRKFTAFTKSFRGGLRLVVGDLNGDGKDEIIITSLRGAPQMQVWNGSGKKTAQKMLGDKNSRQGLELKIADVNGDGKDDLIIVPQAGQAPTVRVLDYKYKQLAKFNAYGTNIRTGLQVAVGNVDGDSAKEIIIVPRKGAGSQVKVFSANGKKLEKAFFAYTKAFRGGVNLAVSDLDADGTAEIIAAPESSGGPNVKVFSKDGKTKRSFNSHAKTFKGGVNLTIGIK